MTSQTLASTLEGFLSGSSSAVVIEDGAVMFDLAQAKYLARHAPPGWTSAGNAIRGRLRQNAPRA